MHMSKTVKMTILANRSIGALLALLVLAMPRLLDWYQDLRPLKAYATAAIMIGFYCCAPVVAAALWNMDRLLRNIRDEYVFVRTNVRRIRNIRWCCVGVCLICLPASVFYPPLVFMVVIMAFLSLVVSVVTSVMDAAVTIREENDLTI